MKNLSATLKRQRNKIILSLIFAIVISFSCYLLNNCPYPYWDRLDKYCWLEYIIRAISPSKVDTDDAFFVNVSYDKQIADYTFDNGNSKGKIAVTDRAKLIRFLQIAEKSDYKYLFLDIRFEEGVYTPLDSVLAAQIKKMDNISYSEHSDLVSDDTFDKEKAAINDYYTTITTTNFTRYQFLQNGRESAALRMYLASDSAAKPIVKHGLFFKSDGHLCQNSPFMMVTESFSKVHEGIGKKNYYHLGPDLFDPEEQISDEDIIDAINNKIIIVGDFVSDLHDTYCGMQPGSYLVYLAYKELKNGKQFVPWGFIVFMAIVYFIIGLMMLNQKNLWDYFPFVRRSRSKLYLFLLNMLGYTTVLSLVTIIMYLFCKVTYNIILPSFFFSSLSLFLSYKKS